MYAHGVSSGAALLLRAVADGLPVERLSVFASGWTLSAAEIVCAGDSVAAADVLEALLQLIRKSLVIKIDARHGSTHYGLLETLRDMDPKFPPPAYDLEAEKARLISNDPLR